MQATSLTELSQAELDELAEIYADFHEGDTATQWHRATPESVEAAIDRFAAKVSADEDEAFLNEKYCTRIVGFWH